MSANLLKRVDMSGRRRGSPSSVARCLLVFARSATGETPPGAATREYRADGGDRADQRLESIIEHVSHVVYIKDREGRYELINSSGEALFGQPREAIVGSDDKDLFGEEEAREIREIDERVMAEGEPATYESRRPIDDDLRVFRNEKYPYRPDGETVAGVIGVSKDVTEEVERQNALERLHEATRELMVARSTEEVAEIASNTITDVLDLPLNGVHLYDPEENALVPLAWSDGAEFVLGTPPPSIPAGEGLAWEIYRRGEPDAFADVRESDLALNDETVTRSELFLPLGDHGIVLIGSTEVDDFDATDEALSRVLAANVETALDRVYRERELERKNERLADFAGVVAHDVRNPLNIASARLDLVREECESEHLDSVADAHERIGALVEDVLTWARGSGALERMEVVELAGVAESCWEGVDAPGATLVVEEDLAVEADLGRLRRVFENLFRNSVEQGGPEVTIRVGPLSDGDGFYVEDDGPGIPAEDREVVFEPGFTTNSSGTGFGLPIVREIVAGHGWTVDVAESEAGGARFEIRGVVRART